MKKKKAEFVFGEAGPFLKWAGGKSQLLQVIDKALPPAIKEGTLKKYFEPFVGGGAVFFHIAQRYNIPELYIADCNEELMLAYRTIQRDVDSLIEHLHEVQSVYFKLSRKEQETYFYEVRSRYNEGKKGFNFKKFHEGWIERTAQTFFLNKNCFNGLFRVNSGGGFNVPFGRYNNPKLCSARNLVTVASILQRTEIACGDFECFRKKVDSDSFVYFDPPYRPLNKTSNFTSYSKDSFSDQEQMRLARYYFLLANKGAMLMLSNSDPKNIDPNDEFFEEAYREFRIRKVNAHRMINSKASKRGALSELIITNYDR